jgi:hypothetical protein
MNNRRLGEPFKWGFRAADDCSRSDAIDSLRSLGLRLDLDEGGNSRLEGGSQLWTRLLGGYFVDPSRLPITVKLEESEEPGVPLSVDVQDRLGIAVRDEALRRRYAARVGEISDMLGRA